MNARNIAAALLAIAGLFATLCWAAGGEAPASRGEYEISGPYSHENLTVYLIHGKDTGGGRRYLTLQEALDDKIVVVRETGDVNELTVENVSSDKEVYVQSGDIVKGGRQDRTIATDFICPPKSGAMPVSAFCVEHGRWSGRGNEDSQAFQSSPNAIAGKQLKLAAKASSDQGEVWRQVSENQSKLSGNAGHRVEARESATSLELSLEDKGVEVRTAAYSKALAPAVDGKPDVIGYAFAINGKMNSADVYSSHELFLKLWPKLLKSSAVEAFAELKKDQTFAPCPVEAVQASLRDAESGKSTQKDVTPRVQLITKETDGNVVFECRDRAADGGWIHRNYLTKEDAGPKKEKSSNPPPAGELGNGSGQK